VHPLHTCGGLHFKSLGTVGNGVKKSPLIIAAVGNTAAAIFITKKAKQ